MVQETIGSEVLSNKALSDKSIKHKGTMYSTGSDDRAIHVVIEWNRIRKKRIKTNLILSKRHLFHKKNKSIQLMFTWLLRHMS